MATVLALAATGGCGSPCSNQAFIGLPAPDGTRIAFVFHRRCAAPANTTTEVTINDARQPLRDEPGNVVSVDGEQPLNVAWVSSDRLRVSGVAGKVNHKNERQGAVTVEFP